MLTCLVTDGFVPNILTVQFDSAQAKRDSSVI